MKPVIMQTHIDRCTRSYDLHVLGVNSLLQNAVKPVLKCTS